MPRNNWPTFLRNGWPGLVRIIHLTESDLQKIVERAIEEHERKKAAQTNSTKSYSIAKAAKILGRSPTTIKKHVLSGKLKTTSDGRRILHKALQEYLKQET